MSIAVVCVEVQNFAGQGERYVRALKAMTDKHLAAPHSFYCITDVEKSGISCLPSIPKLRGWWQKLAIFQPGLFTEDLILYFDLDTFILKSIDAMAKYEGPFSMLRDFWSPWVAASGVMMWQNDYGRTIWDRYCAQGMPQYHVNGDGGWLGDHCAGQIMQNLALFEPGYFASYKGDCMEAPPRTAHVCAFHGFPRPHEAKGWAADMWEGLTQETAHG